jgi:hypothetical protein
MLISDIRVLKHELGVVSFFKFLSLFLVEVSKWLFVMLLMNVSDNSDDLLILCISFLSW